MTPKRPDERDGRRRHDETGRTQRDEAAASRPNESAANAEIEREARRRHGFSLEDAVGRMASGGCQRGESPVPRLRQLEQELDLYLEAHLADGPGALTEALRMEIRRNSNLLGEHFDTPHEGLERIVSSLLTTEFRLRQFVTEVDATWGRMYQERPMFERPGRPAAADDPYTIEGVRTQLARLLENLRD